MNDSGKGTAEAAVVGVVPAAGRAERLDWLPCSKELLPLLTPAGRATREGADSAGKEDAPEPEPVCYGVLRALARAGVERAYVPIRTGKWDVPAHLRGGEALGLALSYVVLEDSPSPAHSIDAAYPFTRGSIVALGFPDVILGVENPFRALLDRWRDSEADVVLGLFPPSPDYRTERVSVGEDGLVGAIDPVPAEEDERPTWTLAVWGPDFGRYLHEAVAAWDRAAARASESGDDPPPELVLGDVLRTALENGMSIEGVQVSEEPFVDVGEPERLMAAMRRAYGP